MDKILLRRIRKWVKKQGNSPVKLAVYLNYKSHSPIYNWLKRGRIPGYMWSTVDDFLTKEEIRGR